MRTYPVLAVIAGLALSFGAVLALAGSPPAGFLWLGNDHQARTVLRTTTTGRVLRTLTVGNNTGIAIDNRANTLFLSSRAGPIQTRTLTTLAVTGRIPGGPATNYEDLAWDGSFLYRADYSGGRIVRITRTTGAESTFITGIAGPVGVAYDSSDKTFWVTSFSSSRLHHYNPSGSPLGDAVSLNLGIGFRVGGLAYDPSSGTLWVGSDDRVFHISKSGQILGFFNTPEFENAPGKRFVDGLEFEPAPR